VLNNKHIKMFVLLFIKPDYVCLSKHRINFYM